jgi:hypothetical protein
MEGLHVADVVGFVGIASYIARVTRSGLKKSGNTDSIRQKAKKKRKKEKKREKDVPVRQQEATDGWADASWDNYDADEPAASDDPEMPHTCGEDCDHSHPSGGISERLKHLMQEMDELHGGIVVMLCFCNMMQEMDELHGGIVVMLCFCNMQ